MQFDWDDEKAALNEERHGVPFEAAKDVFLDRLHMVALDDRRDYGEERFQVVGMVDDVLLAVVFTPRDGGVRIVSARPATPKEHRLYVTRSKRRPWRAR